MDSVAGVWLNATGGTQPLSQKERDALRSSAYRQREQAKKAKLTPVLLDQPEQPEPQSSDDDDHRATLDSSDDESSDVDDGAAYLHSSAVIINAERGDRDSN